MKSFLAFLILGFTSFANSTEIVSATYDSQTQMVTLELAFTGGDKQHDFSLLWDTCRERNGVKEIAARLVDVGHDDTGHQEFFQTVQFDLSGLQCKPAWLTIRSGRFSHKTFWVE